jgi:hypothetical protein
MFTANVGTPDRIIRLVLGLILAALPFVVAAIGANVWLLWALPIVGIVLIGTAFVSWCPIYATLGLSTKPKEAI